MDYFAESPNRSLPGSPAQSSALQSPRQQTGQRLKKKQKPAKFKAAPKISLKDFKEIKDIREASCIYRQGALRSSTRMPSVQSSAQFLTLAEHQTLNLKTDLVTPKQIDFIHKDLITHTAKTIKVPKIER